MLLEAGGRGVEGGGERSEVQRAAQLDRRWAAAAPAVSYVRTRATCRQSAPDSRCGHRLVPPLRASDGSEYFPAAGRLGRSTRRTQSPASRPRTSPHRQLACRECRVLQHHPLLLLGLSLRTPPCTASFPTQSHGTGQIASHVLLPQPRKPPSSRATGRGPRARTRSRESVSAGVYSCTVSVCSPSRAQPVPRARAASRDCGVDEADRCSPFCASATGRSDWFRSWLGGKEIACNVKYNDTRDEATLETDQGRDNVWGSGQRTKILKPSHARRE